MTKRVEPSFASLLVKQSPAMHYGHGWILGKDGTRWHPCRSQGALLADLSTIKQGKYGYRRRCGYCSIKPR